MERRQLMMNLNQFVNLLCEIMESHSWFNGIKGHAIKYVRPHFDTRTATFFGVTLEGLRGKKDFFVVNENRNKDLAAWVLEFLDTPPMEALWEQHESHDTNG
jgi:hypothetical protein